MSEASSLTLVGWVQAGAACAQVFLTAGAVFAAAWLQNRAIEKRETAERNRRLEGAAASSMWALRTWRVVESRAKYDGMDPQTYLGVYRGEEFEIALRALRAAGIIDLGDEILTRAMLDLERAMKHAEGELELEHERAQRSDKAVMAQTFVGKETTEIFNAAASVERRVAHLVGRPAREHALQEIAR